MSSLGPACSTHPDAEAGWRCSTCGSALCRQCAVSRAAGHGRIAVCKLCGGAATDIRVRRALKNPFSAQTLIEAVRWPFHKEGLLTSVACALALWIIGTGALGTFLAEGLVLAILFHVTTSTARGEDTFHAPGDFRGFFEDILGPIFRAAFASIWAFGPVVAYVLFRRGNFFRNGDLLQPTGPEAAVVLLLLLAGTFLFPMALLAGAVGAPLRYLLNPLVVIGYALKLGRDYVLVAVFALAISLFESALLSLLLWVDRAVAIPGVVQYTILLYPPLMLFRALGLLVRARGDELGYGGEEQYLVPVLDELQPEPQQEAPAEIAASPAPPVPAEIELPHETESMPPALALARRVTESDVEGAVEVLQRVGREVPPAALSAQAWIDLSKACLERGHGRLAILALRRALEVAPEGPLAPHALLQAARIYEENLGEGAASKKILAELIERHPQSAEARFAARRLQAQAARGP
jgi:tetratricopeptide (TPR) repeat protein